MIESPVLDELKRLIQEQVQEQTRLATLREAVLETVETRFGQVDPAIRSTIDALSIPARLRELHRIAVTCPSLPAFCNELIASS